MPGGSSAALEEAIDGFETEADADQADLFEVAGNLDAPSPMSEIFAQRGGGRRKGSRNRNTLQTSAWLLSQHRHPLLVMAEGYSMTPEQLADRIGLKKGHFITVGKGEDAREVWAVSEFYDNEVLLALFKLQMSWAEAVAPYVAKKQPQELQLPGGGGDFNLTFLGVSLPARGGLADDLGGPVIEGQALRLPAKSDG